MCGGGRRVRACFKKHRAAADFPHVCFSDESTDGWMTGAGAHRPVLRPSRSTHVVGSAFVRSRSACSRRPRRFVRNGGSGASRDVMREHLHAS